jgi:hypothetical protein
VISIFGTISRKFSELLITIADNSISSHETKNLGILGSKLSIFLTLNFDSKFHTFVSFVTANHFTTHVVRLSGSFSIFTVAFQLTTFTTQL